MKTVPLSILDVTSPAGFADKDEITDIRQRTVWYSLAAARVTRVGFEGEDVAVRPGSLLTINPGALGGNDAMRVVLGSCRPDGMANVFVVSDRPRPGSNLAVTWMAPAED